MKTDQSEHRASRLGIVAFAFGEPADIPANRMIRNLAEMISRDLKAPIYTQKDVAIDTDQHPHPITVHPQREGEGPPPTLRIARAALLWAQERGLTELHVVAAAPHMRRCWRDIWWARRDLGVSVSLVRCDIVFMHVGATWFSPESTQRRTQSFLRWWSREAILLLMPMAVYRRIAS